MNQEVVQLVVSIVQGQVLYSITFKTGISWADNILIAAPFIWGTVKIMVPFWVPIIIRGLTRGLI